MIALIKNAFLSNLTLKTISLIIGYSLWCFIGNLYVQTSSHKIPICFYNVPENISIEAKPEIVTVHLCGKRANLSSCTDLALHLDAATLQPGQHCIAPTHEQLFLPQTVSLAHYKPLVINLMVTKKT